MAIHMKCLDIKRPASTLFVTMQYGPVTYPPTKKGEKAIQGLGVRFKISEKGDRHGSPTVSHGCAAVNLAGELIHLPAEAELTDAEVKWLESEIKELAK